MLLFALFTIFFLPSSLQLPPSNRIVGGWDADITEFPFNARSFKQGLVLCRNSIINENTLISAAHCYDDGLPASDYSILAGETDVRNNEAAIPFDDYILHPNYVNYLHDDIAIIKIATWFEWSDRIQPAVLPPANYQPSTGEILDISGWGALYFEAEAQSDILQANWLRAITNTQCRLRHGSITNGHICGYGAPDRSACNGDSGGPLSIGNMVLGIVSYGIDCGGANEQVFTRVSYYLNFINQYA